MWLSFQYPHPAAAAAASKQLDTRTPTIRIPRWAQDRRARVESTSEAAMTASPYRRAVERLVAHLTVTSRTRRVTSSPFARRTAQRHQVLCRFLRHPTKSSKNGGGRSARVRAAAVLRQAIRPSAPGPHASGRRTAVGPRRRHPADRRGTRRATRPPPSRTPGPWPGSASATTRRDQVRPEDLRRRRARRLRAHRARRRSTGRGR